MYDMVMELAKQYPNTGATILGVIGMFFTALFGWLLKRPMVKQGVKNDEFKATIEGMKNLIALQEATIMAYEAIQRTHEQDREHWNNTRAQLVLRVEDLESQLRPWPDSPTEGAVVIVVEDDIRGACIVLRLLERLNLEGFVTTRGYDALRHLRTGQFRLMILDFGLPDISGIDVAIQARREGFDLPIIGLTGMATKDLPMEGERMQEARFSVIMPKTSRADRIMAAIQVAIGPQGSPPAGEKEGGQVG